MLVKAPGGLDGLLSRASGELEDDSGFICSRPCRSPSSLCPASTSTKMLARTLARAARPALARAAIRPAQLAVHRAALPLARPFSTTFARFEPCTSSLASPLRPSGRMLTTRTVLQPHSAPSSARSSTLKPSRATPPQSQSSSRPSRQRACGRCVLFLRYSTPRAVADSDPPLQVVDEAGSDEIQLTRSFGNERCVLLSVLALRRAHS